MAMRVTIAISMVEAVLVSIWITSFICGGDLGSSHQHWYLEIPLLFLITPVTSIALAVMVRKAGDSSRSGVYFLLPCLLAANLIAFCGYGVMSGGGV
jgi:uncharacterized membrane protein YhaH (DUF805 family)